MKQKKYISLVLALIILFTTFNLEGLTKPSNAIGERTIISDDGKQQITLPSSVPDSTSKGALNKKLLFDSGITQIPNMGHGIIVYGSPHGEYKGGEYRYLGYDILGNSFSNPDFPNDADSGRFPSQKAWIEMYSNKSLNIYESKLYRKDRNTLEDILSTMIFVRQKNGDVEYDPTQPSKLADKSTYYLSNHFHLLTEPTQYTMGLARGWHLSGGKLWYQTFIIPPLEILKPEPIQMEVYADFDLYEQVGEYQPTGFLDKSHAEGTEIRNWHLTITDASNGAKVKEFIDTDNITVAENELQKGLKEGTYKFHLYVDNEEQGETFRQDTYEKTLKVVKPDLGKAIAIESGDSEAEIHTPFKVTAEFSIASKGAKIIKWQHQVAIGNTSNFQNIPIEQGGNKESFTYTYPLEETLYFRVKVWDTNEIESEWSEPFQIDVKDGRVASAQAGIDAQEEFYEGVFGWVRNQSKFFSGGEIYNAYSAKEEGLGSSRINFYRDNNNDNVIDYKDKLYANNYQYYKNWENEIGGKVAFDFVGEVFIEAVARPKNGSDSFVKIQRPVIPTPVAKHQAKGYFKENRLVKLENQSIFHRNYPLAKISYKITDISTGDSTTISPTKFSTLDYIKHRAVTESETELIFKKPGEYECEIYVEDTRGHSDRQIIQLTIVPDDPPKAITWFKSKIFRKPSTTNENAEDQSISPDGDIMNNRKWYLYFDSDNDNNLKEHTKQYMGYKINQLFSLSGVGKYLGLLHVKEDFSETLPEFITDADKKEDTKEFRFEVDNIKPVTTLHTLLRENIDMSMYVPSDNLDWYNNNIGAWEQDIMSDDEKLINPIVRIKGYETSKEPIIKKGSSQLSGSYNVLVSGLYRTMGSGTLDTINPVVLNDDKEGNILAYEIREKSKKNIVVFNTKTFTRIGEYNANSYVFSRYYDENYIYLGDSSKIIRIDRYTGDIDQFVFHTSYKKEVLYADGHIFYIRENNNLHKYNSATSERIWTITSNDEYEFFPKSINIQNGNVYVINNHRNHPIYLNEFKIHQISNNIPKGATISHRSSYVSTIFQQNKTKKTTKPYSGGEEVTFYPTDYRYTIDKNYLYLITMYSITDKSPYYKQLYLEKINIATGKTIFERNLLQFSPFVENYWYSPGVYITNDPEIRNINFYFADNGISAITLQAETVADSLYTIVYSLSSNGSILVKKCMYNGDHTVKPASNSSKSKIYQDSYYSSSLYGYDAYIVTIHDLDYGEYVSIHDTEKDSVYCINLKNRTTKEVENIPHGYDGSILLDKVYGSSDYIIVSTSELWTRPKNCASYIINVKTGTIYSQSNNYVNFAYMKNNIFLLGRIATKTYVLNLYQPKTSVIYTQSFNPSGYTYDTYALQPFFNNGYITIFKNDSNGGYYADVFKINEGLFEIIDDIKTTSFSEDAIKYVTIIDNQGIENNSTQISELINAIKNKGASALTFGNDTNKSILQNIASSTAGIYQDYTTNTNALNQLKTIILGIDQSSKPYKEIYLKVGEKFRINPIYSDFENDSLDQTLYKVTNNTWDGSDTGWTATYPDHFDTVGVRYLGVKQKDRCSTNTSVHNNYSKWSNPFVLKIIVGDGTTELPDPQPMPPIVNVEIISDNGVNLGKQNRRVDFIIRASQGTDAIDWSTFKVSFDKNDYLPKESDVPFSTEFSRVFTTTGEHTITIDLKDTNGLSAIKSDGTSATFSFNILADEKPNAGFSLTGDGKRDKNGIARFEITENYNSPDGDIVKDVVYFYEDVKFVQNADGSYSPNGTDWYPIESSGKQIQLSKIGTNRIKQVVKEYYINGIGLYGEDLDSILERELGDSRFLEDEIIVSEEVLNEAPILSYDVSPAIIQVGENIGHTVEIQDDTPVGDYVKYRFYHDDTYFQNSQGKHSLDGVITDNPTLVLDKKGKYTFEAIVYDENGLNSGWKYGGTVITASKPVSDFELTGTDEYENDFFKAGSSITLNNLSYNEDYELTVPNHGINYYKVEYRNIADSSYTTIFEGNNMPNYILTLNLPVIVERGKYEIRQIVRSPEGIEDVCIKQFTILELRLDAELDPEQIYPSQSYKIKATLSKDAEGAVIYLPYLGGKADINAWITLDKVSEDGENQYFEKEIITLDTMTDGSYPIEVYGIYPFGNEIRKDLVLKVDTPIELSSNPISLGTVLYDTNIVIEDNDPDNDYLKIAASEEMKITAKVSCPIPINSVKVILEGEEAANLSYNTTTDLWERTVAVDLLKPDKNYYDFTIEANAVNGSKAHNHHRIWVYTPIELRPDMPAQFVTDTIAYIKAKTSKYANEVRVILFKGKSFEETIYLSLDELNGNDKEWFKAYNVPSEIPEGTYTAEFIAKTPNGSIEIINRTFTVQSLDLVDLRITDMINHSKYDGKYPILYNNPEVPVQYKAGYYVTFKINAIGNPDTVKMNIVYPGYNKTYNMGKESETGNVSIWKLEWYADPFTPKGTIINTSVYAEKEDTVVDFNTKYGFNGDYLKVIGSIEGDLRIDLEF